MQCNKCHTENDNDSKFCKECGEKLAEILVATHSPNPAEPVQIGELVYAAYKHKEAGRIDDALAACQGALVLNPQSASGHALLGSLYELKGDLDAAVREYEIVAELDPESVTERNHLAELRQTINASPKTASPIDAWRVKLKPYLPHAAAIGSLLVVFIAGIICLRGPSSPDKAAADSHSQVAVTPAIQPYAQNPQVPGQNPSFQPQPQTGSGILRLNPVSETKQQGAPPILSQKVQTPTNQASENGYGQVQQPAGYSRPVRKQPVVSRPSPINSQTAIVPVVKPMQVAQSPSISPITPVDPPAITPVERPSATISSANRTPASYEERAIQSQSQGRYQEAISNYREALSQTHDKGRIYQQIGMCYQRLGERELAVNTYNKAISAFRDQAAAGRDPAEVDMNIKACQRAIQVNK